MKVFIYFVGKPRDAPANRMAEEFLERISHYARAESREVRPDKLDPWMKHPSGFRICLDPAGKQMDSRDFTSLVRRAQLEARDLIFMVGGADGLPEDWRARADLLLSLSAMTFPHELARVMLSEQIYRALATLRGHPYPR